MKREMTQRMVLRQERERAVKKMRPGTQLKERVAATIDGLRSLLVETSRSIHSKPELGFREYGAANLLAGILEKAGFTVVRGVAGLETAFLAEYGHHNGPEQPIRVALLAEYDALPGIGHACGHNLIAAASLGAGLGLRRLEEDLPGSVAVIGTPGEESGGGKAILVRRGVFNGFVAAMMVHPANANSLDGGSLALDAIEFTYHGRPAHAASNPEKGVNALDAVIQLFNGINALRQHLPADVRIHGIITEGGVAPNVIPERAVARFYVRAEERAKLDDVVAKVLGCAQGAAQMTGATLEHRRFEESLDNVWTNKALAEAFAANLRSQGVSQLSSSKDGKGSTDMGNVSHVVPAIHPYLAVCSPEIVGHTREFAQACVTDQAHETMIVAAKALAFTTLDLMTNSELRARVMDEFRGRERLSGGQRRTASLR